MDLSSIMHHAPDNPSAGAQHTSPTLPSVSPDINTQSAPALAQTSETPSESISFRESDPREPGEAATSDYASSSQSAAQDPPDDQVTEIDQVSGSQETSKSDQLSESGQTTNTANEGVSLHNPKKHLADPPEDKPAKRIRTTTPTDNSDDENNVAYTIELDIKEKTQPEPVSPCPALRSASRHPIKLDSTSTPDAEPREEKPDPLSVCVEDTTAKENNDDNKTLTGDTNEPAASINESTGVIAQSNGVKMEEISGVTIREPTGYGNRNYQSRTNSKEDEPLIARLPRTQSPEADLAFDDLDGSGLPPGTRISVQKIDRPRLMTIESRLARLAPLDHHRELSPAPLIPETVGGERNLPVYHRAFRYEHAATNITCFPHTEYTQCDSAPHHAGISAVDRGGNVFLVGDQGDIVTTDGQYGSAKSNVCLRGGGEWYFEIEVLSPDVRIGLGRRESTCEGPVGFDIYSYGLQSKTGNKLHCGRPLEFMEPFGAGDVIGFHINLPVDSKPTRIHRPRVPFVYENQLWLESRDYVPISDKDATDLPEGFKPLDDPEVIPESFCRIYRNGELVGPLAEPLLDFRPPHSTFEYWLRLPSTDNGTLGYYPMISVYRGGAARLITGPDFKFPPPPNARSLQDRYVEQTADNFALDLTNEILFKRLDHILPRSARRGVLHKSRTKKADSHHFA